MSRLGACLVFEHPCLFFVGNLQVILFDKKGVVGDKSNHRVIYKQTFIPAFPLHGFTVVRVHYQPPVHVRTLQLNKFLIVGILAIIIYFVSHHDFFHIAVPTAHAAVPRQIGTQHGLLKKQGILPVNKNIGILVEFTDCRSGYCSRTFVNHVAVLGGIIDDNDVAHVIAEFFLHFRNQATIRIIRDVGDMIDSQSLAGIDRELIQFLDFRSIFLPGRNCRQGTRRGARQVARRRCFFRFVQRTRCITGHQQQDWYQKQNMAHFGPQNVR